MKLTFTTPASWNKAENFGCATQRFAGTENATATFEKELNGTLLTGSYQQILDNAALVTPSPNIAIVFFGNAGGENEFLKQLISIVKCTAVGGGAAFENTPGLVTGNGQAAVFLVQDDRYTYHTETKCIHDEIIDECSLSLADPRTVLTINGIDAAQYLVQKKASLGLPETDFEHLTLTDLHGVNAHLSFNGTIVKSGRDLCEKMQLRYVPHDKVYSRIRDFYDDPDAIIFGCAGLGGILEHPLATSSLGLFLFGEVCSLGTNAEFGNLMLSKLKILPKNNL